MQTLDEYLQTLNRRPSRSITINSAKGLRTIKIQGFQICKNTQKIYQIGVGHRRTRSDLAIRGQVLGSFKYNGGGGYFMRRLDNGKIIQVYYFRVTGETIDQGKRGYHV